MYGLLGLRDIKQQGPGTTHRLEGRSLAPSLGLHTTNQVPNPTPPETKIWKKMQMQMHLFNYQPITTTKVTTKNVHYLFPQPEKEPAIGWGRGQPDTQISQDGCKSLSEPAVMFPNYPTSAHSFWRTSLASPQHWQHQKSESDACLVCSLSTPSPAAVWPLTSHLTSLSLNFFIAKMRMWQSPKILSDLQFTLCGNTSLSSLLMASFSLSKFSSPWAAVEHLAGLSLMPLQRKHEARWMLAIYGEEKKN